jgi:hypothetical protein
MISFALKSENNFFPILVSLKFSTSLQALFPARALSLSLSLSLSHREEEEEEENTTDVNARAREKITVRE